MNLAIRVHTVCRGGLEFLRSFRRKNHEPSHSTLLNKIEKKKKTPVQNSLGSSDPRFFIGYTVRSFDLFIYGDGISVLALLCVVVGDVRIMKSMT